MAMQIALTLNGIGALMVYNVSVSPQYAFASGSASRCCPMFGARFVWLRLLGFAVALFPPCLYRLWRNAQCVWAADILVVINFNLVGLTCHRIDCKTRIISGPGDNHLLCQAGKIQASVDG